MMVPRLPGTLCNCQCMLRVAPLTTDRPRPLPGLPGQIVWTRSGTGALHVLGETFPFTAGSRFAYLDSNHNSVLVRPPACR